MIVRRNTDAPSLPAMHTVVPGESLSSIAEMYYGHGNEADWLKIWEANQNVKGVGGPPDYVIVPHHISGHDVFPTLLIPV